MTDDRSATKTLRSVANQRFAALQRAYLADSPGAVATLARLRRTDAGEPGGDPSLWEITMAELPDILKPPAGSRNDAPTPAEAALHAALVLYGTHQQSQRVGVHDPAVSFGAAVGRLARARGTGGELDDAVLRRMHQAILAGEFRARLTHLRGLVQLMRAETHPVGFNYADFTVDLMLLAAPWSDKTRVSVRWGRDVYSHIPATENSTIATDSEEKK